MIEITIKTLDSLNHVFSVGDDFTVKQLKEHIAESVSVPVESQRLIYCGRVLLDEKKLSEYDVNGKVIHLVQRAPPSSSGGSGGGAGNAGENRNRSEGGSNGNRWRRTISGRLDGGNAMYLGAMAFPADLIESQGITMPQPRQGLSQSRLTMALFMLNRAQRTLHTLENPSTPYCTNRVTQTEPTTETSTNTDNVANAESATNTESAAMTNGGENITAEVSELSPIIINSDVDTEVEIEDNGEVVIMDDRGSRSFSVTAIQGGRRVVPIEVNITRTPLVQTVRNGAREEPVEVSESMSTDGVTNDAASGSIPKSEDAATSAVSDDTSITIETITNDGDSSNEALPDTSSSTPEAATSTGTSSSKPPQNASASTGDDSASNSDNANPGTSDGAGGGSRTSASQNNTVVLANLIQTVKTVNTRMQPFLDHYHNLVRNDSSDIIPNQAQSLFNQVSEMMHYMAHAYHAISDIMCNFSQPPPRSLRCRPVLIQHSAVLQTGIPIQAQMINLSSARPPRIDISSNGTSNARPAASNAASNAPSQNETPRGQESTTGSSHRVGEAVNLAEAAAIAASAATASAASAARSAIFAALNATANRPPSQMRHIVHGGGDNGDNSSSTSLHPGVAVRVHFNGESSPSPSPTMPSTAAPSVPPVTAPTNSTPTTTSSTSSSNSNPIHVMDANLGSGSWEIFMDVGSGSITLENLDAAISNATGNANQNRSDQPSVVAGPLPWGSPPPPDFIQNLIHRLAGEIGASNNNNANNPNNNNGSTTNVSGSGSNERRGETSNESRGSSASSTQTPASGSSQPSSSRPLVQVAGMSSQAMFDPFLPCNSHHIRRTRRDAAASGNDSDGAAASNDNMESNNSGIGSERPSSAGNTSNGSGGRSARSVARVFHHMVPAGQQVTFRTPLPLRILPTEVAQRVEARTSSASYYRNTVFDLLETISGRHRYRPGDSFLLDIIMTIAKQVNIHSYLSSNPLSDTTYLTIRPYLVLVFHHHFRMETYSDDAVKAVIDKVFDEIKPFLHSLTFLRLNTVTIRDDVDLLASIRRVIQHFIPIIVKEILQERDRPWIFNLSQPLSDFINAIVNVIYHSSQGITIQRLVFCISWHLTKQFEDFARFWACSEVELLLNVLQLPVHRELASCSLPQFVVQKSSSSGSNSNQLEEQQPMETDSVDYSSLRERSSEPLPEVIIGSEQWHHSVPADWVPIITRDSREQRRAAAQGPLSDTYLTGMPSKRRKVVSDAKPHHTLTKVISESMSVALGAAGIAGSGLDGVAENAAGDVALRSAFKEQLRSTVETTLRNHPDFTPDKYPNAAKYFNPPIRRQ